MSMKPLDEEALFHAARRIAAPEARELFISQACGDNAGLAGRVRALLEMHEQEPESAAPAAVPTQDYAPVAERPGTRVGPYRLMEQIGEGGFGLVFVAEQQEPVRRKVALKIIKPGMDSRQVIARFEAERQALALMDHPNIARVLDAGATDSGRPYFVMELVRGIPITDYCDKNQLSPKERLELFISVCQAIQHAHQKGIIHRDVKPSNVLVTSHDGKPVAKVIDFGVAKAIHQHLTERTIYTQFAQMIGTPLYMSPEQAEMSGLDIDTRSDIYSLGVLLYELLTGTTPLEKKRFREAAYDEIRRLIREEEPPRPSTRLSTSESIAAVAAQRNMEPAKLSRLVRGDLDWITMKALEKDRTRRYETANGLARDIQRYLSDEPVEACPPSTAYRLRKFARKHRAALTTAAAIGLLLVVGVAISAWQAVRATRAEAVALQTQKAEAERAEGERLAKLDAQARQAEAEKQQTRAEAGEKLAGERLVQVEAEKKKADEEKQIAQAVRNFLQYKLLAQTDTQMQADALLRAGESSSEAKLNPTIRELLDRAAQELAPDKIEASFPKQPLIQAELLQTMGDTYRGIGEYQPAIDFLKRSAALRRQHLGPDDPDTLVSMGNLANAYQAAGKLDLALPLFEETLKRFKAKLGPEHSETLKSMTNLAAAYHAAGKLDRALPLFEDTLKLKTAKLGPEHPLTLTCMNGLSLAYQDAGKLDLALPLFEETLKLTKAKLGPDHPETLTCMSNLALAYQAAGKPDLALPLHEETLKLRKAKLGPDHPATLNSLHCLASAYQAAGKLDLALPLLEETLRLHKAKLGPAHPATLRSMNNLAAAYWEEKRLDKSIPLFEETLKLIEAKLGRDHPDTLLTKANLGQNYKDAGRLKEALPLLEETLNLSKAKLGPEHPETLLSMNNLAGAYKAAGKLDLALPLLEETLKLQKAKLGPEHPSTRATMGNLGNAYCEAGQGEKAAPLLKEFVAAWRKQSPKDDPRFAGLLAQVALDLLKCHQCAEAEPLLRECLAIRKKTQPEVWSTFNSKSQLGGALLGQKKYNEAEPLLLAGYEGMKAREKAIPPQGSIRIPEALDRLVELYTATNNPDAIKKWQAERAKYPAAAPPLPEKN